MAVLEIRYYGDPVLRERAEPIEQIEKRHHKLAKDMADTMYMENGIGLAGNQIGILERIVVVDVNWARAKNGEKPPKRPIAMINPEIIDESVEDDVYNEGCLSIPTVEGEVWRPIKVKVRYQTLDGKTVEEECEGLHARCIQHEIDHLNGVLFVDRMGKLKRRLLNSQLAKIERATHAKLAATKRPEGVKPA